MTSANVVDSKNYSRKKEFEGIEKASKKPVVPAATAGTNGPVQSKLAPMKVDEIPVVDGQLAVLDGEAEDDE